MFTQYIIITSCKSSKCKWQKKLKMIFINFTILHENKQPDKKICHLSDHQIMKEGGLERIIAT